MQREIAELLAAVAPSGLFAVQRSAPAAALSIEVTGVGRLNIPLATRVIDRLRDVATPSRFGFRDKTVFDRSVRNGLEIARHRIRIDQRRWNRTLIPLLDEIRAALGLAEDIALRAELHNMLIYERGQFFRRHQDSEKGEAMIGTLVVTLPSPLRGGELTVERHGEVMAFRGSRTDLQLVAFYADCRHEVHPVTAGARVVLTYNLLAKGVVRAQPPRIEPDVVDALAGALRRHFETALPPRFGGEPVAPDRLVYLLDHEYTARGLRWDLLKSADAARAAALRAAAERLDCEVLLAQADVHETWECEGDWEDYWRPMRGRSYRRGWDDFDDDFDHYGGEDNDSDDDDVTPSDLIDSEIELRSWAGRKPAAIASAVRDEELCYSRPSSDLNPFQSEHTGYMGNWGNTLDRWYHRGAVVIWPRERTFVIRARASASWALKDVLATLRRGKKEEARRKVETLLPFWSEAARVGAEPLMPDALRVTGGIDDTALASRLLSALPLETFDAEAASLLAPLVPRFGQQWSQEMLSALSMPQDHNTHVKWLSRLARICETLRAAGDEGRSVARWLASWQWEWLEGALRDAEHDPSPSNAKTRLNETVAPLVAILESARTLDDADLQESIVRHLAGVSTERRVGFLMALLRAMAKRPGRHRPALSPLHNLCTQALAEWLKAQPRARDDWSIAVDLGCRCQHCRTLSTFLAVRDRKVLEWPLAKDHRAHIHRIIDGHELPVAHQTRRAGRPYILVLTKRETLFSRDAARRQQWAKDLAWLEREGGAFVRRGGLGFGMPMTSNELEK
jgi:hypothetical protein